MLMEIVIPGYPCNTYIIWYFESTAKVRFESLREKSNVNLSRYY